MREAGMQLLKSVQVSVATLTTVVRVKTVETQVVVALLIVQTAAIGMTDHLQRQDLSHTMTVLKQQTDGLTHLTTPHVFQKRKHYTGIRGRKESLASLATHVPYGTQ